MAVAVIPLRVGDVDMFVEVTQVAGSEQTSVLDTARERATEAFDRARQAIVAVAQSTAQLTDELAARAVATPESVEVEFGLKFSAQGNIIVAGASGEATLTVRMTFPGHG